MNRAGVVAFLVCLLVFGTVQPGSAALRRSPADCAATLDCTAEDINLMTMPERLEFVRTLSSCPMAELLPGYQPRWRNIEGIIMFFRDNNMGAPGSWVSYVDSGIVEGIERGLAIATGRANPDSANPGSALWASYLTRLAQGGLTERSAHDRAWSEAEQASTEYGVTLAERVHGVPPSGAEGRFYQFSEFYRFVLRNRLAVLDLFSPPVGPGRPRQIDFFNWFTDVTNSTPSYRGAVLAYDLAEYQLPAGLLSAVALMNAYAWELWDEFAAETA